MIPSSFEESTGYLDRPSNMTDDECVPLAVAKCLMGDDPVVVSCWKISKEEIEEFARTGRIWLVVLGETMPPVILTATKPMTNHGENK
jgi:hypothetical protein